MGRSRRRRLIPAVQLAWLVAFLAAAVVAAVRHDWTGLSLALLWACLDATALRVIALEHAQEARKKRREREAGERR